MAELPILFSGPMVRAILEDRKTQTRRVVKGGNAIARTATPAEWDAERHSYDMARFNEWGPARGGALVRMAPTGSVCFMPAPYDPGDILWVRETWAPITGSKLVRAFPERRDRSGMVPWGSLPKAWRVPGNVDLSCYKADGARFYVIDGALTEHRDRDVEDGDVDRWFPSIFMPRWAARLFLRVTEVRVERLQDITEEDAVAEGITRRGVWWDAGPGWEGDGSGETAREAFAHLWDSRNAKRGFGWDSNPWVWVYRFERTEAPRG